MPCHRSAGQVLVEANGGTGATVREYIWLGSLPLAVIADVNTASPQLWHVHADHLERPVLMTDGAKAAVWDAVFLPFGGVHAVTGAATLNARFPGQWFQVEAGLHYNLHRNYDPTIGRYTQPDPLGVLGDGAGRVWLAEGVGPASLAFGRAMPDGAARVGHPDGPAIYGYARLLPTSLTDPTGLGTPLTNPGSGPLMVTPNTLRLFQLGCACLDIDLRGHHFPGAELHFWTWKDGRAQRCRAIGLGN